MNKIKVANIRKNQGLTQENLAELSGLTVRTIQRLEGGKEVSLTTINLVANALNVKVVELFDDISDGEGAEFIELDKRRLIQARQRSSEIKLYRSTVVFGIIIIMMISGYFVGELPPKGKIIFGTMWIAGWPILFSLWAFVKMTWLQRKLDYKYPLTKGIFDLKDK